MRIQIFVLSGMVQPKIFDLNVNGLDFKLRTSFNDDHFRSVLLSNFQDWEVDTIKSWIENIHPGDTVIDVGAYLGVFSLLAIQAGAQSVVAYEPNGETYRWLEANVLLNHCQDRLTIRNLGLSDHSGSENLIYPPEREMSSGAQIRSPQTSKECLTWGNSQQITINTLDNEVKFLGLGKVAAIKIDTEGYELYVLRGAKDILRRDNPLLIVELQTTEELEDVSQFLASFGYNSPKPLDGVSCDYKSEKLKKEDVARNYLFRRNRVAQKS